MKKIRLLDMILIQWDQRKDPTVVIDNSTGQIEK